MLILRIRRAETAMADGRLDEAFELVRDEDVRSHRRGQELIGRLAKALLARAREHLDSGRLAQAGADCDKASRLGGNLPSVEQMRDEISRAVLAHQRRDQHRADAMAAAHEHIDQGRISIGREMLAELDEGSGKPGRLLREADGRREAAKVALKRAQAALDREDGESAIDALLEARQMNPGNDQVNELALQVTAGLTQEVRARIDQGRLDLAESLLERLGPLAGDSVQMRELGRIIDQCRLARDSLEQGRLTQAEQALRRLAPILPDAQWLNEALGSAQQAADSFEHLQAGPLGLLTGVQVQGTEAPPAEGFGAPAAVPTDAQLSADGSKAMLPGRLMMHVDGVGSFVVLRGQRVTVGSAKSSARADVGLLAGSGLPTVAIERVDDDYFLSCDRPVHVNDKPTSSKLLGNDDVIALSRRCRLRFGLPSPASTTGVLNLSGTRLPRGDARRVILLDRDLIIGPGPSSHIRVDEIAEPIVLYLRDGRLLCRTNLKATIDGRAMGAQTDVPLDAHVQIGPVSFVIKAA